MIPLRQMTAEDEFAVVLVEVMPGVATATTMMIGEHHPEVEAVEDNDGVKAVGMTTTTTTVGVLRLLEVTEGTTEGGMTLM